MRVLSKFTSTTLLAGAAVMAMSIAPSAGALVLDFSSQAGTPGVTFGTDNTFYFGDEVAGNFNDFQITNSDGAGTSVGYSGDLDGVFSFDTPTAFGIGEIAEVHNTGTLTITDGLGGILTAEVTWITIQSSMTFGSTNIYGEVNLVVISNTSTDEDLMTLFDLSPGVITTSFSFALPAPSLTELGENGGTTGNYSGQMSVAERTTTIPEPATVTLFGAGVCFLLMGRRRFAV